MPPLKPIFLPETLEAILLLTDAKTVLLSQRVCRQWNDVIKNSNLLQIKLFFRPLRTKYDGDPVNHQYNHMIEDLLWPKIKKYYDHNFYHRLENTEGDPREKEAFTRKEASWRRMLVHQPPCAKALEPLVAVLGESLFSKANFDCQDRLLRLGNLEVALLEGKLKPRGWDMAFWLDRKILETLRHKFGFWNNYLDLHYHLDELHLRLGQIHRHECNEECSGGGNTEWIWEKFSYRYLN